MEAQESGAPPPARTRDHLANERTYLAWLRTAANVMVLGLAIAKFVAGGDLRSITAGILLVATGTAGVIYSACRYRATAGHIKRNRPTTAESTIGPLIAGATLIVAVAAAFVLILI